MRNGYKIETAASAEREDVLTQALVGYNRTHSPFWEQNNDARFQPMPLTGRTYGLQAWLKIGTLWMDEDHRGQGIGRELIGRAEEEARRRGCFYARLSTSTFQAPGFYEKMGYVLYGRLEDYPPGDTSLYYRKDLHPKGTA